MLHLTASRDTSYPYFNCTEILSEGYKPITTIFFITMKLTICIALVWRYIDIYCNYTSMSLYKYDLDEPEDVDHYGRSWMQYLYDNT